MSNDTKMTKLACTTLAWAFQSTLSQDQILTRLNEKGSLIWDLFDNYYLGDYISGKLTKEAGVRIYEYEDRFILELRFCSAEDNADNAKSQLLEMQRKVLEEVLPMIEARNVLPTESFD